MLIFFKKLQYKNKISFIKIDSIICKRLLIERSFTNYQTSVRIFINLIQFKYNTVVLTLIFH